MRKFIYVFSDKDKERLLDSGYKLMKSDEENHVYIFLNQNELRFNSNEIDAAFSDILTF